MEKQKIDIDLTKGRVQYRGRRKSQYFVGGEKFVLNTQDWIEVSLRSCIEFVDKYSFKPDKETENAIHEYRYPNERYETINGMLKGKRCFVVGRGASLTGFDFGRLDNEYTIAVNHAFEHFDAKAVLFLDQRMVEKSGDKLRAFNGLIFARTNTRYADIDDRKNVFMFGVHQGSPQARIQEGLYTGALSGLAAINLAMVMGAEKIYLLGYDMKGGYFDGSDPSPSYMSRPKWKKVRMKLFNGFAGFGTRIINCSPDSDIDIFPYADIDEVLSDTRLSWGRRDSIDTGEDGQ